MRRADSWISTLVRLITYFFHRFYMNKKSSFYIVGVHWRPSQQLSL